MDDYVYIIHGFSSRRRTCGLLPIIQNRQRLQAEEGAVRRGSERSMQRSVVEAVYSNFVCPPVAVPDCVKTAKRIIVLSAFITQASSCTDPVSSHVKHLSPLKPSVIIRLHFECSAPCRSNLPLLISEIRARWRSGLSARVPECPTLKVVG